LESYPTEIKKILLDHPGEQDIYCQVIVEQAQLFEKSLADLDIKPGTKGKIKMKYKKMKDKDDWYAVDFGYHEKKGSSVFDLPYVDLEPVQPQMNPLEQ
jgi:hypothetical protein